MGADMEFPALRGRSILVVEDEPLIGMEIRAALEDAGAFVTETTTVRHALILIDHDGLAGAIIDHALGDGNSAEVCVRLKARGIPYVSYSGYDPVAGASPDAPHVSKPAPMDTLLRTLEALLPRTPRVS
jgi:DNA-binding response OmpR family regulator